MKYYKYTLTLKDSIYPRHLADRLSCVRGVELVSIKDMQNNKHIYGDTYYTDRPNKIRR